MTTEEIKPVDTVETVEAVKEHNKVIKCIRKLLKGIKEIFKPTEIVRNYEIINRKDIEKVESFNLPVITEAIKISLKYAESEDEYRKRLEKRIFYFLSVNLFSLYFLLKELSTSPSILLLLCSAGLVAAGLLLVYTFRAQPYSAIGIQPTVFFCKDYPPIFSKHINILPVVLCTYLYDFIELLDINRDANNNKRNFLNSSIILTTFSLLTLFFNFLIKTLIWLYT